jgi:4-diphosphocytidyl-2-C-methyl-D-erythritol kinase
VVLNSYAKLNLYLKVISRRKDNYHNLKTIFERIDLADKIILKSRRDNRIKITTNSDEVPCDESNLAFRAAQLLKDKFNLKAGADIKIIKRIPVASGMAGGSSNAACVLMGLNKLWKLHLNKRKLLELGKSLGADVPFFISNYPFARGLSRGDEIYPLKPLGKVRFWHIVVVPRIQVSTTSVYQKWDKIPQKVPPSLKYPLRKKGRAGLTSPNSSVKMLISALRRNDFSLIKRGLFNSLEQASIRLYPEIARIKERLTRLGLKSILMSGSGPAVFGMVSSRKEALSLGRQLKRNRFWRIYATRTI